MKVFKIESNGYIYSVAGLNEKIAIDHLFEIAGEMEIDKLEEVKESEWDKKEICMHEDNDVSKEKFMLSIRELIVDEDPTLICTTDSSLFD